MVVVQRKLCSHPTGNFIILIFKLIAIINWASSLFISLVIIFKFT